MRYADRLRLYLLANPAVFTASDVLTALPAPLSTVRSAIRALCESGEIILFECKLGLNIFRYQATEKLGAIAEKKDRRTLPRRRSAAVAARLVRFVETAQDADPENGVYYHRPQPAQAAMQAKSGPGMLW